MPQVKVSRSYQITIPAEIRGALGIEIGDILSVSIVGNKIVLEKIEEELPTFKVGRKIGEKDLEEALVKGLKKSICGD